jgi:hypothetical protein
MAQDFRGCRCFHFWLELPLFHSADFCASFGLLNEEPIYRPEEVAGILECDIGHIYDLIRAKKLRAADISTGRKPIWRIRHSAIIAMLEADQSTSAKLVVDVSPPVAAVEAATGAFSARRAARKAVVNGRV